MSLFANSQDAGFDPAIALLVMIGAAIAGWLSAKIKPPKQN